MYAQKRLKCVKLTCYLVSCFPLSWLTYLRYLLTAVGGVAQWSGRQSLAGGLSLIYV